MPRQTLLLTMLLVCTSCRGQPQGRHETSDTTVAGKAPATQQALSLDSALNRLKKLKGVFDTTGPDGSWRFSGGETAFQEVADQGEVAVGPLLSCMKDSDPSGVTANRSPVLIGVLCNLALQQTVIYEPVNEAGELQADWPGFLFPTASATALAAAYAAWTPVVANHAYHLP